ncbi:unnamed protein product [Echinostoma caproni]|uniref:Uncharacterized protein n=1 Tax=Echinostoma caproni TaxID=27848 RepID=A0A183AUL9_9TREM|nr:unnamed protein product [Echinostoma caproni]
MESLPQYMERLKAVRPPFASPPYPPPSHHADIKSTQSTAKATTRPLSDLSNHAKSAPTVHKHTPNIPADSAFARRKAYDARRNLARLSHHTPHRNSTHNTTLIRPNTTGTPLLATPANRMNSTTTVPRRDPRDVRPGLSVVVQRERTAAVWNRARNDARRALVDSRRGL